MQPHNTTMNEQITWMQYSSTTVSAQKTHYPPANHHAIHL